MELATQVGRPIMVQIASWEDDLLLLDGFSGEEAMSRPFFFSLELLSDRPERVDLHDIVGKNVTVSLTLADDTPRHFNGFIIRFAQIGRDATFTHYRAEVVPWLWFLSRRTNCRIFQEKTVKEILEIVFDEAMARFGSAGCAYDLARLSGAFPKRDYCVQYRESDLSFVSRLMEEEGIAYYFTHDEDVHTLVLANAPSGHDPCPGQETATLQFTAGGAELEDVIEGWTVDQELRSGKYSLRDYNFQLPKKRLEINHDSVVRMGSNDKYEIYDYPGSYAKWVVGKDQQGAQQSRLAALEGPSGEAGRVAGIRIQEEEATVLEFSGTSTCRGFRAGFLFDLEVESGDYADETHERYRGRYLLTSVRHMALGGGYRRGEGLRYSNDFVCIPQNVGFVQDSLHIPQPVTYRPPRATPKPVVQGPQTAVVCGKQDEEIWTDKYGRIKVQFHWDREHTYDENSSCWVRVATIWAGKQWGAIHIPRIGQEVIVDFLEGDPDRPLVVGSVYNADHMPPYTLPENQTQSGIKSRSSKKGTPEHYNEIKFEDKKGKESLSIHAEKDMSVSVENDQSVSVGHDKSDSIKHNKTIKVDGTHTETIKGDTKIEITAGIFNHDVKAKTATYHVKGAVAETFEDTQTTTVTKKLTIESKADILIQAADEIKLQVGAHFISIKKDGTITISSDKINSTAGTENKMGVGNQNVTCNKQKTEISGAAINSSAVGMHEITGALVKIN